MKHIIISALMAVSVVACSPNPEQGERSSGTTDVPGNQDASQAGQPIGDSTADNTSGNGSVQTPSDNTIPNQQSETSGAAGQ